MPVYQDIHHSFTYNNNKLEKQIYSFNKLVTLTAQK